MPQLSHESTKQRESKLVTKTLTIVKLCRHDYPPPPILIQARFLHGGNVLNSGKLIFVCFSENQLQRE